MASLDPTPHWRGGLCAATRMCECLRQAFPGIGSYTIRVGPLPRVLTPPGEAPVLACLADGCPERDAGVRGPAHG
jgi:hypothetical protein